jgi:D-apionate oxidoisomerase
MTETVALFGAAGKIGTRISGKLSQTQNYRVLHVEAGESGMARLRANGLEPTSPAQALAEADIIILAVPDRILVAVSQEAVPQAKSGALFVFLDPAVPVSGLLPKRADIAYFVTHPCHPPVITEETEKDAIMDFYGGLKAKQSLVCALLQGDEKYYQMGEAIVREMFAPILRVHRITVEQMAVLEPAMAETVVLTCMFVMKEAMEEAVKRGVPQTAAFDFLMGHIKVNLGIQYGFLPGTQFSDGALRMVERAKGQIFQPDWRKVFEPANLESQVNEIIHGPDGAPSLK